MRAVRRFFARFANLFRHGRAERDLAAEIEAHLALMQEEFERRGMAPDEARREALVKLGGVERAKEMYREARSFSWIEQMTGDMRYALRQLVRSPGFAATAILTLALGIGVNTAIFTVFDEVAFRPLPVKDGDRIVGIYETFRGQYSRNMYGNAHMLSYPEFEQYSSRSKVFSEMAAYADVHGLNLEGERPEPVTGLLVSEGYFGVLGAMPALGRTFVSEEMNSPHAVAVLGNSFWQRRLGGDPGIIGKTIRLNQNIFTVIGVTQAGFSGAEVQTPDVWLPLSMQPLVMTDLAPAMPHNFLVTENLGWLTGLGKLKPGVTAEQAEANLQLLATQLDLSSPGRITQVSVIPSTFLSNPDARAAVLIGGSLLLVAVGLVLFVACANIANLLLARAAARQKEIAVRAAIGATRGRLIRQLLTESALLSLLGGGLGLFLAWKSLQVGRALVRLPSVDISPDLRVLAYTLFLTLAASLMFGLLPAIQSTNPDLAGAMKEEGSIFGKKLTRGRLRGRLITVQVAVCAVLLLLAGLLVRGLLNLNNVDPGFYVKNVVVTNLDLRLQNYNDERSAGFYRDLLGRIDAEPGVASTLSECTPWQGICGDMVLLDGQTAADAPRQTNYNTVSSNYFDVMGIRILQGRAFTETEVARGDAVAVISLAMQKAYWNNGEGAIGKKFSYGFKSDRHWVEVVGVTADVRSAHAASLDGPFFYRPLPSSASPSVITRFQGGQSSPGSIQRIVEDLDPNVAASVTTMEEKLARQNNPIRIGALMALLLGGLVLMLATVGIYGVTAYVVSQRTREIAIRITLGAEAQAVVLWTLRETMRPVLWGMAIGIPIAAALSIASSKLLLGVHPLDPIAFVIVSAFLASIALVASYLPARQALRVDPMVALRHE
jgi:predicted permease